VPDSFRALGAVSRTRWCNKSVRDERSSERLAKAKRAAHDAEMARRFWFRVREGQQIHAFGDDGTVTHGAGYEFVLSEKDAAGMLRHRASRYACELVEVVDDEAATPPTEQPAPD